MSFIDIRWAAAPLLSCPMHEHAFCEIIYQLDAPTNAIVAGKAYRVEPGEMIIVPPATPHRTVSDTPFRDMCIKVSQIDMPMIPTVVRDSDGTIRALFELLLHVQKARKEENRAILEKLCDTLVLCIKNATSEASEPAVIARFKRTLLENLPCPDFNLTAAVRALGYHPDYFRRYFKECTGVAPLAYLNRMRLERARELLRLESSLSVSEIALLCGYRDPLYFSTAFRRHTGLSPVAYRKQYNC